MAVTSFFMRDCRPDEKTVNERRNVLASIAQRRDGDDERAETKVEILAEGPGVDSGPQIPIRRGDHAGVDLDVAFGAHAPDLTFLQGPK